MVSKWLLALAGVAAAGIGAAALLNRASGAPVPAPIPQGATYLVPTFPNVSGVEPIITVNLTINGVAGGVDSGLNGGLDLTFDGVDPYTIVAPSTVLDPNTGITHTFQYWVVFGPNGALPEVTSTTLQVPAGTYTVTGTQMIAYYT